MGASTSKDGAAQLVGLLERARRQAAAAKPPKPPRAAAAARSSADEDNDDDEPDTLAEAESDDGVGVD